MVKKLKEYLIINLGLLLVAWEIHFIMVPNKLVTGGVSGFAILINEFAPQLSVGMIMLLSNLVLFIAGFMLIGFEFGTKTIYSSFAISGMVWVMEKTYPISVPLSGDILQQLIFAMLMAAVGTALVFSQGASTGGTDIVAKILNKYFGIDIGKGVLMSDLLIVLSSGIIFNINLCIYGILGVIINGYVIDYILRSLNTAKEIVIIADKSADIKDFIIDRLGRGATIYAAKGAYTNDEKEVIRTILTRKELLTLKKYIKVSGQRTFITVNDVHEIFGEGFIALE